MTTRSGREQAPQDGMLVVRKKTCSVTPAFFVVWLLAAGPRAVARGPARGLRAVARFPLFCSVLLFSAGVTEQFFSDEKHRIVLGGLFPTLSAFAAPGILPFPVPRKLASLLALCSARQKPAASLKDNPEADPRMLAATCLGPSGAGPSPLRGGSVGGYSPPSPSASIPSGRERRTPNSRLFLLPRPQNIVCLKHRGLLEVPS